MLIRTTLFYLQVKATDADEGLNATITYSLKKSSSLFSIEPQTGVIKTQARLINKKKKHILTVLATDHGNPPLFSEVDVMINVIESNDEPQFEQSFYEITIPENFTRSKTVTRVTASSRNSDLHVFYNIEKGNTPDTNSLKTFNIDPQGIVRLSKQLDRETSPTYTLTIRAETSAEPPLSSFATLRLILADVNDCAPEFLRSRYDGTVSENVAIGTPVLQVSATDGDLESVTVYSMLTTGNEHFTIHHTSGLIRTKQIFNREKKGSYVFSVQASDDNNPSFSRYATVTVKITDTNDLPPVFESKNYTGSVEENKPNGTVVGIVTANDGDDGVNAKITYSIKSGNIDGNFRINPDDGRVIVNGKINYEVRTKYELVVEARDGKHQDTARMVITVENVNDNNPEFETKLYSVFIEENSRKGTLVTTLRATDPDALWIKYKLSSNVKFFKILPNTGEILTNTVLDREKTKTYTFEAYAYDHHSKTGTAKVIVHVLDQNDNTPIFLRTSLKQSVPENKPPGFKVGTVNATDLDDVISGNGRLSYEIIKDPANAFTIDRNTGILRTRVVLNRENTSTFILTVNASDHGKPSRSAYADVIVTVLDVNDNSPIFSQDVYEKTIAEDAKIELFILQLVATDDDIGMNANLR